MNIRYCLGGQHMSIINFISVDVVNKYMYFWYNMV